MRQFGAAGTEGLIVWIHLWFTFRFKPGDIALGVDAPGRSGFLAQAAVSFPDSRAYIRVPVGSDLVRARVEIIIFRQKGVYRRLKRCLGSGFESLKSLAEFSGKRIFGKITEKLPNSLCKINLIQLRTYFQVTLVINSNFIVFIFIF